MAKKLFLSILFLVQMFQAFGENQTYENFSLEEQHTNSNVNECIVPSILDEFYEKETNTFNMKAIHEFYKVLRSQMYLRYGKSQINKALKGFRSKVKFDELDNVYFAVQKFYICTLSIRSNNIIQEKERE
jgi:hypothetical protein